MIETDTITPAQLETRGTPTAEELVAILARARAETASKVSVVGQDHSSWRYVALQSARAVVDLTRARNDTLASAGQVAVCGLSATLLFGPIGAVVGVAVGWLWDKFNETPEV
jgi:hypothetical protein